MTIEHPFERSWWVEPGKVLAGCCPGPSGADPEHATLEALFSAGVRSIISLMPADECDKAGKPRRSYREAWEAIGAAHDTAIHWRRAPIPDMGVPSQEAMAALVQSIANAEKIVYIHCWGGSGRTGTAAGCYLTSLGHSADQALECIRQARSHSPQLAQKASPQTVEQRAFISDFGA